MRCEQAIEALSQARYAKAADPALDAHLEGCAACRARADEQVALDRMLDADDPALPGPGFDTRFFARLEAERARVRRMRRLRLGLLLVPGLAAAAAAVLMLRAPSPAPEAAPAALPAEELALAMDLELVQDLDVVARLDELEAYEVLGQLEEDEIDRLLAEAE